MEAQYQQDLVAFAQRLIQTPGLSGSEEQVAEVVRQQMEAMGYDEVHTDDWGNVVGVLQGGGPGSVLFDAHMDTVPWNGGRWLRDPLGGEVSKGRIWGRGTTDMKGAIAAAIYGIGLLARQKGGLGTVYVSCSVAEEPAEGPALVKVCQRFRPQSVVIMEATELRVNIGQRGRAELIVETMGKPAHSSSPQLGVNAVKAMARLIQGVEGLQLPSDPLLGPAILEVTDVKSHPYPGLSVVPSLCRATFDRRLLVEDTPESVLQEMHELARGLGVDVQISLAQTPVRTYTDREFTHEAFAAAWKTDPQSPLVRAAVKALTSIGQAAELGAYSFCTNGSGSAGVLVVPTIGYGPGRESEAHVVDEYLELEQLYQAADGYRSLARGLSALEVAGG